MDDIGHTGTENHVGWICLNSKGIWYFPLLRFFFLTLLRDKKEKQFIVITCCV